jgi:hypothetical protein
MEKPMLRAALALSLLSLTAVAQTRDDWNLSTVPRTGAENARVVAMVAPTKDFIKPDAFEGMPAGAATVRARDNADAFSQLSANMPLRMRWLLNWATLCFAKYGWCRRRPRWHPMVWPHFTARAPVKIAT